MATTAAIAATSDAIRALLLRAATAEPALTSLDVDHFRAGELQNPPPGDGKLQLSLWLHRVAVGSAPRLLPGRTAPDGTRLRPPISVDLHYLVTAWAASPTTQQWLLGWAVRALEDQPTLPSTLLNDERWAGTFWPEETVELTWAPLTAQEESDLWQVAQSNRQASASYIARTVAIESRRPLTEHPDVQTRELGYTTEVPA